VERPQKILSILGSICLTFPRKLQLMNLFCVLMSVGSDECSPYCHKKVPKGQYQWEYIKIYKTLYFRVGFFSVCECVCVCVCVF